MYVNKHRVFYCSKSKTIHGGTPVQTIMYISITKGLCVLSSSGTNQLGMFDIQATTKSKYYDQIVLLYLESRRCRYRSIIFVCFYLYVSSASYHVYKHYRGCVYFNYTYRLLFIAFFDDFNLIISIFHCLCPSCYLYLSNR
jgi:hypothetical protein